MNREIEFRAWDGKRMTTSGIMFNCSNGLLETPIGANMKLMQFTGLTDKNGVKIFEGDVLEFVGKVYYADACFFTDNAIPLAFSEKHRVVIGNIYENKNLIL